MYTKTDAAHLMMLATSVEPSVIEIIRSNRGTPATAYSFAEASELLSIWAGESDLCFVARAILWFGPARGTKAGEHVELIVQIRPSIAISGYDLRLHLKRLAKSLEGAE